MLGQQAGCEILDHHVVRRDETADDLARFLRVEPERDAALVGVQVQEAERSFQVGFVVEEGGLATGAVSLRWLHLQHARAVVSEQLRRVGTGNARGEVQDPHAIERAVHRLTSRRAIC